MSRNEHGGRKSKLETREVTEDEYEIIRKMEEETNMAVMHLSENYRDGHEYNNTTKPPVQLAVNIEVEPCEEIEDLERDWCIPNTSDAKVAKQSSIIKSEEPNTNSTKVVKPDDTPLVENEGHIDTDNLFKVIEEIIEKSENPIDVSLAIHTRSLWGKLLRTPHRISELDRKINSVLDSWRTKETIITYKCYICLQAWWFLYPFKEHIQKHKDVEVALEKHHIVANVIAYEKGVHKIPHPIHAFGDCHRCNRGFSKHVDQFGKYMKCYIPADRGFLIDRNEKCTICEYYGNPEEHYGTCHSVRSDVPIETKARLCRLCNEYYYVHTLHECAKKKCSMLCYCCHRYFGTGLCLESHILISNKAHTCKYCNTALPRQCMEPFHFLTHTSNFMSVELCPVCKGNLVYFSPLALAKHMTNKHRMEYVEQKTCMTIIPKRCYFQLEEAKFELYQSAASTSRDDQEECFEITDNDGLDFDPSKVKIEYGDDDDIGYEMLLSKVFNSSKCEEDPVSNIKDEPNREESMANLETEFSESNLNETKFFVIPSKVVNDTVDSAMDVDIESNNTNIDDIIHQIMNKDKDKLPIKHESSEQNTNKKIHNDVACKVVEVDNNEDKDTDSDNDDVEIIEVKNEILIIDDDIDYMETEDIVCIPNEIYPQIEFEPQVKIEKDADNIPINSVQDKLICSKKDAKMTEIVIEKKHIETKSTLKECSQVKTQISNEIQATTSHDSHDSIKPKYHIKIEHGNIQNAIEETPEQYFQISDLVGNDSDSDDRLHIAFSDAEYECELHSETETRNSNDNIKVEVDPNISELSKPKLYKCKCGFVSHHRPYKIHLGKCGAKRTYNKSKNSKNHKKNVKDNKKTAKKIVDLTKNDFLCDVSEYTCTKCDKTYQTLTKYLKHFTQHGYRKNICPVCMNDLLCYTSLHNHVKVIHIGQNYFKSRSILSGVTSSAFLGYHCKICRKQVQMKQIFKHWEQHFKLKEQETEVKEEDLREINENTKMDKTQLKEVIDIMQPGYFLEKSFWGSGCLVCGHLVKRRSDYKRHLIEHLLNDAQTNRPIYGALRCHICTYDALKERDFRDHMRDHACLTIYKCGLCNIEFSNSSNFSKHKKLHDPNALTCDICKKKFQSKYSIEKHMLEVHLDTSFLRTCKDCDLDFTDKQLFRMHLKRKHKGKGYNCKVCQERYSTVKLLWDHLWTVHKQRNVTADCFLCGKQFRRFNDLKKHTRVIHRVLLKKKAWELS